MLPNVTYTIQPTLYTARLAVSGVVRSSPPDETITWSPPVLDDCTPLPGQAPLQVTHVNRPATTTTVPTTPETTAPTRPPRRRRPHPRRARCASSGRRSRAGCGACWWGCSGCAADHPRYGPSGEWPMAAHGVRSRDGRRRRRGGLARHLCPPHDPASVTLAVAGTTCSSPAGHRRPGAGRRGGGSTRLVPAVANADRRPDKESPCPILDQHPPMWPSLR